MNNLKCYLCLNIKTINNFHKSSSRKSGYYIYCKECVSIIKKEQLNNIDNRCKRIYRYIKQRCEDKNHNGYKKYGAKGIKCNITVNEIKALWSRDKAINLNKPSIDRIDSNKDYTFENCRFIELSLNSSLANLNKKHSKHHNLKISKGLKKYYKIAGIKPKVECPLPN